MFEPDRDNIHHDRAEDKRALSQADSHGASVFSDAPTGDYQVLKWQDGQLQQRQDCVAEEVPIALIYNGISHAVMLATPKDLNDFALGFSLSEGILSNASELYEVEIIAQEKGIELYLQIASERFAKLKERRRSMTGRTGCGLCGSESLDQAMRIPSPITDIKDNLASQQFSSSAIFNAHENIRHAQPLQTITGATHASAWVRPDGSIAIVREDVGRHNALDKLIGARAGIDGTQAGFVITTSRASYEMVQKVASAGVPMLVAISAPTGLAIRIAETCGVTLVGFARHHQHVIYSHAQRVTYDAPSIKNQHGNPHEY